MSSADPCITSELRLSIVKMFCSRFSIRRCREVSPSSHFGLSVWRGANFKVYHLSLKSRNQPPYSVDRILYSIALITRPLRHETLWWSKDFQASFLNIER